MAKILTVDDVDVERINMVSILKKLGHIVIEARNGQEALEVAAADRPDVIFMDIVMPVMDGFSATKRLMMSGDTKSIPVVIVSSKSQDSDRFRANQLGAKGYVVKPARQDQIADILKGIL